MNPRLISKVGSLGSCSIIVVILRLITTVQCIFQRSQVCNKVLVLLREKNLEAKEVEVEEDSRRRLIVKRTCVLVLEWQIGQGSWSWYSSIGISIRRICAGFLMKE